MTRPPRRSRFHVDDLSEYLDEVPVAMKPLAFLEWLIDPVDRSRSHGSPEDERGDEWDQDSWGEDPWDGDWGDDPDRIDDDRR